LLRSLLIAHIALINIITSSQILCRNKSPCRYVALWPFQYRVSHAVCTGGGSLLASSCWLEELIYSGLLVACCYFFSLAALALLALSLWHSLTHMLRSLLIARLLVACFLALFARSGSNNSRTCFALLCLSLTSLACSSLSSLSHSGTYSHASLTCFARCLSLACCTRLQPTAPAHHTRTPHPPITAAHRTRAPHPPITPANHITRPT
jgi:hypothetical protein